VKKQFHVKNDIKQTDGHAKPAKITESPIETLTDTHRPTRQRGNGFYTIYTKPQDKYLKFGLTRQIKAPSSIGWWSG